MQMLVFFFKETFFEQMSWTASSFFRGVYSSFNKYLHTVILHKDNSTQVSARGVTANNSEAVNVGSPPDDLSDDDVGDIVSYISCDG